MLEYIHTEVVATTKSGDFPTFLFIRKNVGDVIKDEERICPGF